MKQVDGVLATNILSNFNRFLIKDGYHKNLYNQHRLL